MDVVPTDPVEPRTPADTAVRPVRLRWAWWLLAYVSLGVGIVGIFVPGLPTTVFVLISAWAAARELGPSASLAVDPPALRSGDRAMAEPPHRQPQGEMDGHADHARLRGDHALVRAFALGAGAVDRLHGHGGDLAVAAAAAAYRTDALNVGR